MSSRTVRMDVLRMRLEKPIIAHPAEAAVKLT